MSADPYRTPPEAKLPLWDATEEERRFWDTRYHANRAAGEVGSSAARAATSAVEWRRTQLGKR